jgi:MFS superfamily sulfate permease-like transporter
VARRILGWLCICSGSVVFALGAFLAWAMWDATAWGFDSVTPTAVAAAAIGGVTLVVGLVLLRGHPAYKVASTAVLGFAAVVLAIDLFARDAGSSLLGELDGWQGSDAEGVSSLAPVWALLVLGILIIAASVWCRRSFGHSRRSLVTATTRIR